MIGFINVIKPTGVSSGYVVNRVKRLTGEKVGHLGTLDPLASGILPIAVGKATRFFDYFLNKEKKYFALAKFGVETDSLDSEGRVVSKQKREVTLQEVENVCREMVGESLQMPPKFSAKTVNGVRAYQAAIKNIDIELKPKKVQIYALNVKKWHNNDIFAINIHCSSGTYVRSIIRDIAARLKTVATTVAIIRTKSGFFEIENGVTIEELEADINSSFISINKVLGFKAVDLNYEEARQLFSGKEIDVKLADGEYLTYLNKEEFSIAEAFAGKLKNKIFLYEGDVL